MLVNLGIWQTPVEHPVPGACDSMVCAGRGLSVHLIDFDRDGCKGVEK